MKDKPADRPNWPGQVIFTDKPEKFMAPVIPLRENNPIVWELQKAILELLDEKRFEDLSMATIVGVLEFVKFNTINACDR
jgi:hypothetical protein